MDPHVQISLVSSLEKIFPDQPPIMWPVGRHFSGFQNEVISFQTAIRYEGRQRVTLCVHVESPIADYIRCREVALIPSGLPAFPECDANYLRTQPGLFPDLLRNLTDGKFILPPYQWRSLWFDIYPNGHIPAGKHPVIITLIDNDGHERACLKTEIAVMTATLPEQKLMYTQWFHADCLSDYYRVPVFSGDHWRIMENFIRAAVKTGINMILTPLVTPPLDTAVGAERPTVQLLTVYLANGEYSFCFDRLKKWIDLCTSCGIRYFEMSHLFTQWGAACCPKVIASVNGCEERIFGWDTKADSDEYRRFLAAMLPALAGILKEWGLAGRCWFHISDEPDAQYLDNYLTAKQMVEPYLKDFPIIDALSSIEYFDRGIVQSPVCATDHIDPFLERDIPELWAYYCCAQSVDVSNRFFAMPSARNRIIGFQLYKHGIKGFLHWGYNFYNSAVSARNINPYQVTDADFAFPSGDAFSVYPGLDGQPEESVRSMVFLHALQDMRALELLESLTDKACVVSLLENCISQPLTFKQYPQSAAYLLDVREKVNNEIMRLNTNKNRSDHHANPVRPLIP
jgi:hypothetical protein